MRSKSKSLKLALMLSLGYLLAGNLAGWLMIKGLFFSVACFYAFFPYTFVWFGASMEGWDSMCFMIESITLFISFFVFYPIGLIFLKKK